MRVLYLGDRLSVRGGADLHLRQVIKWAVASGHDVRLAVGRIERGVGAPPGVCERVVRGLASATSSSARLGGLEEMLAGTDIIHAQNIMNPVVLRRIAETGRAVVTVQDHRVFCPAMGKTLPDGARCVLPFERADCRQCLTDEPYRTAVLELTRARRDALRKTRLIVLSSYMRAELDAVGLDGAVVIPPWTSCGRPRTTAGGSFLLGGRLVAHKGVLTAYEGWRRAGKPLPLEVAGEGPQAVFLGEARHFGWLTPGELQDRLRSARAVLFPAFWQEPFGILGIEALAQGTPVVVSATGGAFEWSDRGCLRVEPGDSEGMANAIRRLSENSALAMNLGEQGRLMVAERFSESGLAPRLDALYREAIG